MCMPDLNDFKPTDKERDEIRQFNGRMIEDLCKLGEKIVDAATRKTAAEQCGMTQAQYRQAEADYLYGDLSHER